MGKTILGIILVLCMSGPLVAQPYDIAVVNKVQIPFEYQHNFIVVKIKINKLPLNFLFDTGAEHTLLFKKSYGDILQLKYSKRIPLIGSDMSRDLYALIARRVSLELYPIIPMPHDILVLEEDFTALDEITGISIDGILGASFFKHYTVKIDYKRGLITFYHTPKFERPGKKYKAYPLRIVNSKPYIPAIAEFGGKDTASTTLLMDTGAGLSLLLHSNTHDAIRLPDHTVTGNLGSGLGGYLEGYVGKIDRLEMLNFTFTNVVTSFQDIDNAIMNSNSVVRNGIIGNEILKRFDIIIDYPREILYLRARHNLKNKFEYDRSGMVVFAIGLELDEFLIHDVIPGTPAYESGLQKGDIIHSLQRFPSQFYTLSGIMSLFRKRANKKIRIVVNRDGEKQIFTFRLRDLI